MVVVNKFGRPGGGVRGAGAILVGGHKSCAGGSHTKEEATKGTGGGPEGSRADFLMDNSTANPCESRVGRLSLAYRTGNHGFSRESSPLKWFRLRRCLVRALGI
jgi:hypothetical protein